MKQANISTERIRYYLAQRIDGRIGLHNTGKMLIVDIESNRIYFHEIFCSTYKNLPFHLIDKMLARLIYERWADYMKKRFSPKKF